MFDTLPLLCMYRYVLPVFHIASFIIRSALLPLPE